MVGKIKTTFKVKFVMTDRLFLLAEPEKSDATAPNPRVIIVVGELMPATPATTILFPSAVVQIKFQVHANGSPGVTLTLTVAGGEGGAENLPQPRARIMCPFNQTHQTAIDQVPLFQATLLDIHTPLPSPRTTLLPTRLSLTSLTQQNHSSPANVMGH
jgi:hypothetical protein